MSATLALVPGLDRGTVALLALLFLAMVWGDAPTILLERLWARWRVSEIGPPPTGPRSGGKDSPASREAKGH